MRRCDEYDRERAYWNRQQNYTRTDWGGYNYRPVETGVTYTTPLGTTLRALKVFPSKSKRQRALNFSEKTGGCFVVQVQVGNPNVITSRIDFVVVKNCDIPPLTPDCKVQSRTVFEYGPDFDEIYSNDDH